MPQLSDRTKFSQGFPYSIGQGAGDASQFVDTWCVCDLLHHPKNQSGVSKCSSSLCDI